MSFSVNFPLFLIVLSLISSVVSSLLPRRAARVTALTLYALSFAGNLTLFLYLRTLSRPVNYLMGHFPHPWGNELILNPVEAAFSALFSLVLFLCILGGHHPLEEKIAPNKQHFYYVMTDLVQASLLVLVYTNDLFTGYVFIEICTLSSCGILMIRENGRTILASIRYMIFSLIGSGLFLFGVIFLYNLTGHLLMPELKESITALYVSGEYHLPLLAAMSLICIGLAIKSGLCPFHLWMADTYGAAIPASSAILSGLISKGYIFFLIKVILSVFGKYIFYTNGLHNVLYVLGAAGIVIGSVSALQEDNIFRMIAYSSAAQIGYIYMGIGLSATVGMEAALFQILTHAMTKPALFLAVAHLSRSASNVKKFHNLQGAAFKNPFAGFAFTFGAFSMIGLPFTMGFISKYLFGLGAFDSTHTKLVPTLIVLAISTILNTLYFARTVIRLYNKPAEDIYRRTGLFSQKSYVLAGIAFIFINLFFGIFARSFIAVLAAGLPQF